MFFWSLILVKHQYRLGCNWNSIISLLCVFLATIPIDTICSVIYIVEGRDWGFKKFIRRDYILDETSGLLQDDKLTFVCEISVVAEPINISGQTTANKFKTPDCRLSEDFGLLLNTSTFSDVILKCDNREFKAHKAILSGNPDHLFYLSPALSVPQSNIKRKSVRRPELH